MNNNNEEGEKFLYPWQMEEMSVDRAFDFLDTMEDGHGYIYASYSDFFLTLVTKCNVDPDFVYGTHYVHDREVVKQHILPPEKRLTDEEKAKLTEKVRLEREKRRRAIIGNQRGDAIDDAKNRYDYLHWLKKLAFWVRGMSPRSFDKMTTEEIKQLYKQR